MRRLVYIVLLTSACALAAAWLYAAEGSDSAEARVFSGIVESRSVRLGPLVSGRVKAVHVDEGDRVVVGQPLLDLDSRFVDLQVQEQRARVEQVRAQLALAMAGPREEERRRAQLDWQNAERERDRLEALLESRLIPQQQYESVKALADIKRTTVEQHARGSRAQEVQALRAMLEENEAKLGYLKQLRDEMTITSPVAGVVQSFDLRPGDLVAANEGVLTLLEPDQLWVRIYVPETQLGLVGVGQTVQITVDTFPDRIFEGTVVSIREQGEYTPRNIQTFDERTSLVFGVRVVVAAAAGLKPGMAALITLTAASSPEDMPAGLTG